jgi:type I restriction enzyme R subunit
MPAELEWKTRKDRVDRKLTFLYPAWSIVKYRLDLNIASLHCRAVEEFPTQSGPADYALFVQGRLLGIIEAKKVKVGPANVLEQAKRYARGASDGPGSWNGCRVPFLYSKNGEVIYFLDVRNARNLSRRIEQFHTADALEEMFGRQAGFEWFRQNPVAIEKLRSYQKKAIEAVEAALAEGRRAMLVAMTTGTGKTFMTVAQIYRLLESKAVRRMLFLVDRRALAAQAVHEFVAFTTPNGLKFDLEYDVFSQRFRREDFDDDKPYDPKVLPRSHLTAPQASHTFVYVSAIQRKAVNLFGWEGAFAQAAGDPDYEDEDTGRLDIPIHAFDAVKIGLTATPAAHTLSLFNEVVYRYTTDEAIADGWLVDYDAVRINSKIRMHGAFLKEGEPVGIVDT